MSNTPELLGLAKRMSEYIVGTEFDSFVEHVKDNPEPYDPADVDYLANQDDFDPADEAIDRLAAQTPNHIYALAWQYLTGLDQVGR